MPLNQRLKGEVRGGGLFKIITVGSVRLLQPERRRLVRDHVAVLFMRVHL